MVLRRTYESTVVLKRIFYNSGPGKDLFGDSCSKSTSAAAGVLMTSDGAELDAEEALPAGWL